MAWSARRILAAESSGLLVRAERPRAGAGAIERGSVADKSVSTGDPTGIAASSVKLDPARQNESQCMLRIAEESNNRNNTRQEMLPCRPGDGAHLVVLLLSSPAKARTELVKVDLDASTLSKPWAFLLHNWRILYGARSLLELSTCSSWGTKAWSPMQHYDFIPGLGKFEEPLNSKVALDSI